MKDRFFSLNKDFVGFIASMACAIHCSLLPLALTFGALSGLAWMERPWVEAVFIILSIIIATWSLADGYFNKHKNFKAIAIVIVGFSLIIMSRFVEGNWEAILTTLGGIGIAVAHYVNWTLLKTFKTNKLALQ
ncbi:MAG: MerC domain-containing protein [Bacteroidota bacterium]